MSSFESVYGRSFNEFMAVMKEEIALSRNVEDLRVWKRETKKAIRYNKKYQHWQNRMNKKKESIMKMIDSMVAGE